MQVLTCFLLEPNKLCQSSGPKIETPFYADKARYPAYNSKASRVLSKNTLVANGITEPS